MTRRARRVFRTLPVLALVAFAAPSCTDASRPTPLEPEAEPASAGLLASSAAPVTWSLEADVTAYAGTVPEAGTLRGTVTFDPDAELYYIGRNDSHWYEDPTLTFQATFGSYTVETRGTGEGLIFVMPYPQAVFLGSNAVPGPGWQFSLDLWTIENDPGLTEAIPTSPPALELLERAELKLRNVAVGDGLVITSLDAVLTSLTGGASDPGATPVGEDVAVTPVDAATGAAPVSLAFDEVVGTGTTTLEISGTGPPPPTGFRLGTPPTYFDLETTAAFVGGVEVCIAYGGLDVRHADRLRLFHYDGAAWEDITTSNDVAGQVICGRATSLSPFIVAEQVDPLAKAECRKGGWERFGFRNQGQCVRFVETGKDSR